MFVKFSKLELDAIDHRLSVPDAIAEALEAEYTSDSVETAVLEIDRLLKLDSGIRVGNLTTAEKDVLRDCVEGSTWAACLFDPEQPETDADRRHAVAVLRRIAKKLEAFDIIDVTVPTV